MIPNEVEILLVEDNPNDEELTLKALSKHNFSNKVHVVRDGAEALDYIFAEGSYSNRNIEDRPKLVLLDLKLPKVDGIEVLRRIKTVESTKVIPVVVLTSSNQERDVIDSYRLGVNSYIVKPVDFDKFIKAVSDVGLYWLMLVEFVQDYLQLRFDGPCITCYVWPIVATARETKKFGDSCYRDSLCSFIAQIITDVVVREKEAITIIFDGSGKISIPLLHDENSPPQLAYFDDSKGQWSAW